jgi:hypothetical protein
MPVKQLSIKAFLKQTYLTADRLRRDVQRFASLDDAAELGGLPEIVEVLEVHHGQPVVS